LSRHFEYANEQITYNFWLCLFLRNSRRKSGVGKMNGTVITNRLQNSFKIKDNNVYRSSYYWNFRTSSFKQVACLILTDLYSLFFIQKISNYRLKLWHVLSFVITLYRNILILFYFLQYMSNSINHTFLWSINLFIQ
jgi:hypothetical protein